MTIDDRYPVWRAGLTPIAPTGETDETSVASQFGFRRLSFTPWLQPGVRTRFSGAEPFERFPMQREEAVETAANSESMFGHWAEATV